jgi:hypothetical protein
MCPTPTANPEHDVAALGLRSSRPPWRRPVLTLITVAALAMATSSAFAQATPAGRSQHGDSEGVARESSLFRQIERAARRADGRRNYRLTKLIDAYLAEFPDGHHRDEVEWQRVYWANTYYEYPSEQAWRPAKVARTYYRYYLSHPDSPARARAALETGRAWFNAILMIVDSPSWNFAYDSRDVSRFKARAIAILEDLGPQADESTTASAAEMLEFLHSHRGMARSGFAGAEEEPLDDDPAPTPPVVMIFKPGADGGWVQRVQESTEAPDFMAEWRAAGEAGLTVENARQWSLAAEEFLESTRPRAWEREEVYWALFEWTLFLSGDRTTQELLAVADRYLAEFSAGLLRDRFEWEHLRRVANKDRWDTPDDGAAMVVGLAQEYEDYLAEHRGTQMADEIRMAIAFDYHTAAELIEYFPQLNNTFTAEDSEQMRAKARRIWRQLRRSAPANIAARAMYFLSRGNVFFVGRRPPAGSQE